MTGTKDFPEAARIERSTLARLEVAGADARDFLQRMTSNDVAALGEGEGCATLLLERTGRVIDRLIACERGESFLLIGGPGRGGAVREALEKFVFAEDVTLADLAGATALVTVLGTRAPETLGAALGVDLAGLAPFHHRAAKAGRETALVVRAEDVGGRAFHVVVPAAARAELERCLAAVSVLDEYGWRTLRVASGVPEFGEDYGERTVAPELGMTDAISFTKGCYPGQEIVARVRTYGQAKRSLVRLRIAGGEVPARGTRIVDGSSEIGTVSSAGLLAGSVFALGFVHTGRDAPGTRLALADEAGGREVEVLPRAPEGGPA